jgi:hypothetical protein
MKIKDYFEYQGNTIKEQIENLLKESNYGYALSLAEKDNLIDKQIEIYEKMLENCGTVSTWAGENMKKYGLLNYAKKYYEEIGDKSAVRNLRKIYLDTPENLKMQQEILTFLHDDSEENHNVWELIHYIKEGNEYVINELSRRLYLSDLEKELVWNLKREN